jgi:hypothetical protein
MGKLLIEDIEEFVKRGYDTLIETGTGPGAITVNNLKSHLDQIHSIELSEEIFRQNSGLLAGERNVRLYLGDSAILLKDIVDSNKDKKCIIWLDAHYSGGVTGKSENFGECPILKEIEILGDLRTPPVILIDDCDYFLEKPPVDHHKQEDWPSFDQIRLKVLGINKDYKSEFIKDDICLFYIPKK